MAKMIDLFFCVAFCLMFILLCYYGIFNQNVFLDDVLPNSNYSPKELESIFSSLYDKSYPSWPQDKVYYPIPYFHNAIESLSKDDDAIDKALRTEITYNVEPIPATTLTFEQCNYVGGADVFSDLKDWHTDEKVLAKFGNRILQMCKALTNQTQIDSFLNQKFLNAILDACLKLEQAIVAWPYKDTEFPWGNNWYQFSVSIPYQLVTSYYILRNIYNWAPKDVELVKEAATTWISKLTVDPAHSIGWKRTGPNTILVGAPWTVVQYWLGKLDEAKDNEWVKYMMNQANVNTVTTGEGMRPDGGYIFHNNVRAYGYIASSLKSANMLNCILPNNFGYMYQYLSNIMCHPTIDANLAGLFSRGPTVKRFMNVGQLGSYAQYSSGILTYKQPNWFIQIMGCVNGVAYYEADKDDDCWAPAWIMLREMWTRGTPIRQYNKKTLTQFPGYTRLKSDVSGESPSFPTKTTTTTSMVPTIGDSAIISKDEISVIATTWQIDGTGDSYYKLLDGVLYREVTWVTPKGRNTVIIFAAKDHKAKPMVHTMELGVVLKKQQNGVIRLNDGKNVYAIAGNVSEGNIVDIDFRDGHTEKQQAFFIEANDSTSTDPYAIAYIAYSVWFDNSEQDIEPPYKRVELVSSKRGVAINVDDRKMTLIIMNVTNKVELYILALLFPEKIDTDEEAAIIAPICTVNPKAVFAINLGKTVQNFPLGLLPVLIPPKDRVYSIAYIPASEGIPGAREVGSYYVQASAHDFHFQLSFRVVRYLAKYDLRKNNVEILGDGVDHGNFFWPILEVRTTEESRKWGKGLAWSYLGPHCTDEILENNYKWLERKYGLDWQRADYVDMWDEWKF